MGNVSLNLVGTEAAWRKRLDFCKRAVFTELNAQGIVQKRPLGLGLGLGLRFRFRVRVRVKVRVQR